MIDENLRPYLLEVNQMPSFATDSPLDFKIKKGVITDTLSLLNLTNKFRQQVIKQKKEDQQRRLMSKISNAAATPKKVTEKRKQEPSLRQLDRLQRKRLNNLDREEHERKHSGRFTLLYPLVSQTEEDLALKKLRETPDFAKITDLQALKSVGQELLSQMLSE